MAKLSFNVLPLTNPTAQTSAPASAQPAPTNTPTQSEHWGEVMLNAPAPVVPALNSPEFQNLLGEALVTYVEPQLSIVRQTLTYWLPKVWGVKTQFVPRGIDSIDKVLEHAKLFAEWEAAEVARNNPEPKRRGRPSDPVLTSQRDAERAARRSAHDAYIEACQQRKAAIEAARLAWRDAVQKRDEAVTQWNAHVKTMHDAYETMRNSPAPVPPHLSGS